jgi:hypothetical protein
MASLWQALTESSQFCLELNDLAVVLEPECTAASCPQMKATDEWLFLCAAHKAPQEVVVLQGDLREQSEATKCFLQNNELIFCASSVAPKTAGSIALVWLLFARDCGKSCVCGLSHLILTHSGPQCNAISYIYHTLDGAASFLNNEKLFPNR